VRFRSDLHQSDSGERSECSFCCHVFSKSALSVPQARREEESKKSFSLAGLFLVKAYRSSREPAGWCRPCVTGTLRVARDYEPQWGSDVFAALYQSLVAGRPVARSLLNKEFQKEKHDDNASYRFDALDWEGSETSTDFKDRNLEPIVESGGDGYVRPVDRVRPSQREELFSAKEA